MKTFKSFSEEVKGDQLVHHGETTKHFDMCPSALKAFDKNQKDGMGDKDGFHEAVIAVDKYLGFEKMLAKKGSASDKNVNHMADLVKDAKAKISKAGLSGHTYHSIHMDKVKDLKRVEENYKYDYGTPESVKLMKKTTPGQKEEMEPSALKQKANAAAIGGDQGLASKYMQQYRIARQRKDAQRAAIRR